MSKSGITSFVLGDSVVFEGRRMSLPYGHEILESVLERKNISKCSSIQPEREGVVEKVGKYFFLPGGEVGAVGGGFKGEEDVALVQRPQLGDRHPRSVEQVPRMEEQGVELSHGGKEAAVGRDDAVLFRTVCERRGAFSKVPTAWGGVVWPPGGVVQDCSGFYPGSADVEDAFLQQYFRRVWQLGEKDEKREAGDSGEEDHLGESGQH